MAGTGDQKAALRYYDHDGTDPLPVVLDALREAGRDIEHIEIDDLAGIDEFHALGRSATMALAELAGVTEGTEVIDVGAGLGGPARFMAARCGAHVTAVEPIARFRETCAELNRRAGLADLIRTVDGTATALPVPDASMDVAWMEAVAIRAGRLERAGGRVRRDLAAAVHADDGSRARGARPADAGVRGAHGERRSQHR